jgi:hypothetical protein
MPAAKRKRYEDSDDKTMLRDIRGIGSQTFTALGSAGYPINPRSTVGDFKRMTGSMSSLEAKLQEKGIGPSFVLGKLRSLWSGIQPGGQGAQSTPEQGDQAKEDKDRRTAAQGNFLLGPQEMTGTADGEKADEKEIPEVDVLHKQADPTKAVGTGNLSAQAPMTVIPDVTLNISPADQGINPNMEVLPGEPVHITPAIAVGPVVREVRETMPLSMDEKVANEQFGGQKLETFKANEEKDLGGDGSGALTTKARVGKDEPLPYKGGRSTQGMDQKRFDTAGNPAVSGAGGGKGGKGKPMSAKGDPSVKWRSVMIGSDTMTHTSKTNIGSKEPDKEIQEKAQERTGIKHPFKVASLFRDHDMRMKYSKKLMETEVDRHRIQSAAKLAKKIQNLDASWTRYNPMTQGVVSPYLDLSVNNPLERDAWITSYQYGGPAPLMVQNYPSPMELEDDQGPFH